MLTQESVTDCSQPVWPRAAVFDCDGLLVDSAACWEHAYGSVCREYGASLEDVDLRSLTGASIAGAAAQLARDLGRPVEEQGLRRAVQAAFTSRPPAALPGVDALIAALATRMPLAVASNAPHDIVVRVLDVLAVRDRFDAVVSAEEMRAHKPAPDVYLEACRRLVVAPCDAIAFEDSATGARAARAAGMVVIAVPSAPGSRIDADLTVARLDDRRLLDYLGLRPTAAA